MNLLQVPPPAVAPGLHWIDYLLIILSLVVSVGVGFYFARGQKTTDKFYTAQGRIPAWAIGMSILATLVSSVTFLAYPGEGFSGDWVRLVQGLMVPLVLLTVIWVIVPLYRSVIRLSAYEYFERRFGYFARFYGSLGFILAHFSKMGTVFYLLSLAVAKFVGVDTLTVIWAMGAIVVVLTLVGGIEAVIWLDVIQGFLLMVGGVVTLLIILFNTPGGPSALWETAAANGRTGFGSFNWNFVDLTFWVMAVNGIFYAIQKYGTDQTVVQRYLTASSDKDAIRASLLGVLLSVPVWALFIFIGTALFSFYQLQSIALPPDVRPDAVFPIFIMTQLPVGITGLVVSALLAAAISSLDSDLNCLSAVLTEDFYGRMKKNVTDHQKLVFGKAMIVVSGVLAMLVATVYVELGGEGVLGIVFSLYAIFSGGIAGMFLLGLFVPRANWQGLYLGIGACVVFTAYGLLTSTPIGGTQWLDFGPWNFRQHNYMLGVYSHLVLFGVGLVASYFFRKPSLDENLTYYGWSQNKRRNKQPQ